jgi:hypothetical protein
MQKDEEDVDFEYDGIEDKMVVYRDSDRFVSRAKLLERSVGGVVSSDEANTTTCAHDRLEFNRQITEQSQGLGFDLLNRLIRREDTGSGIATGGSRVQLGSTVGNTAGCPTTRQVALVAAAVDCSYINKNGNASTTRSNIISNYNKVYYPNVYF